MRSALAILAAVLVALTAAAPHVHSGPAGGQGCMACLARGAEEAGSAAPDVRPAEAPAEAARSAPGLPPVAGFPQGAIPGQSPPRA
ncbi:MAG TPA: hypothetical protein VH880_02275 [Anaeromyxobacteraceae bacterium]